MKTFENFVHTYLKDLDARGVAYEISVDGDLFSSISGYSDVHLQLDSPEGVILLRLSALDKGLAIRYV